MSRHTSIVIALLLLVAVARAPAQSEYFQASADIPVENGGVLNDYTYTHDSDNQYEGITELRTGGAPYQKETYLVHKWAIPVSAQYDSWAFHLEAYHTFTEGSGYDDFNFAWSPDNGTYYRLLTVTKTSDDDTYQIRRFYPPPTDTIYIRVTDTVRNGFQGRDTIYVDHMYVENYHDNTAPVISDVAHALSDHAWVNLSPAVDGGPLLGRERFAMAYHSGVDKVILFGGDTDSGFANDTWIYDYGMNTWSNAQPQGDLPAPRFDHAMAYDRIADKVFLFGGGAGSPWTTVDDMWEYDYSASTWTQVSYSVEGGTLGPRQGMQLKYDASVDALILFGGYADGVGRLGDTWAYDASTQTWHNLSPTVGPSPRAFYAMAYAGAGQTVLFGGSTETDSRNDETWLYNSALNAWANMTPDDAPPGRIWATMACVGLGQVMLFGGNDGDCQLNDTWAYDVGSNEWYQLDPDQVGGELHPREAPAMVSDAAAPKTILFGGFNGGMQPPCLGDTWEYVGGELVASITWSTDELADSVVYYGTNPEYLDSTASSPGFLVDHTVVLRELEPNSIYYYQVQSTDTGGNTTTDPEGSPYHQFSTVIVPNQAPAAPSNPSPEDDATDVGLGVDLSVYVSDPDGDDMDVSFWDDEAGVLIGMVYAVPNGTRADVSWEGLSPETMYGWYAVADDSQASTQSATWHFTTTAPRPPEAPSVPSPADGATGVGLDVELSVYVSDPDSDEMDVSFYEFQEGEPNGVLIGRMSAVPSGTYANVLWAELAEGTTYGWYAVADDSEASTQSATWYFTTGSPGAMYVWDISWRARQSGPNTFLTHIVTVRYDSDQDGVAEQSDALVSDATVYSTLTHTATQESWSFSGLTENGVVEFKQKVAAAGEYEAEVTNITHDAYGYTPEMDVDNPDTFGLP